MENLDYFGKIYISNVMDKTFDSIAMMEDGTMKGNIAERVRFLLSEFNEDDKSKIKELISIAVKRTVFNTLFMFEEHENIKLLCLDSNLVEESDGLSGELYSSDGWIEKFSRYKG